MWLAENIRRKNYAKNRHLRTIAPLCQAISLQLRHVSKIGKISLNSNISSTCPHNMVNFCPLMAEISLGVCGTPANFDGFRVFISLLHQRRLTEVNETFHDVWPSGGLLHSVYIFGGSCPLTEFCQVQHSQCVQVMHSPILAALLQDTRAVCICQTLWHVTRKGIRELSLLICATYILQGGHHVGHRPIF